MTGPSHDRRHEHGRGTLWLVALGVLAPIAITLTIGAFGPARCDDPSGDRGGASSMISVTVIDPKDPKPDQSFVYADPPQAFAPVVHVASVDGARAEVAVRDERVGGRFQWIAIDRDRLTGSLLRAAAAHGPGPGASTEAPFECGQRSLADCLRMIDSLRSLGQPALDE